jgi:hypothetical protein
MPDPITLVKDISQVVKKFNDLELMKQIVDLQTAVFDQQQEILKLSKELASTKEQLELKNKLKLKKFGDVRYYVLDGEEVPYCPVCYGKERQLIPLPEGENFSQGFRRICPSCKNIFYEKPAVFSSHTGPMGRRHWME